MTIGLIGASIDDIPIAFGPVDASIDDIPIAFGLIDAPIDAFTSNALTATNLTGVSTDTIAMITDHRLKATTTMAIGR